MPQVCQICAHESVNEINAAIIKKLSLREIASTFNLSYKALWRHKENHIPPTLAKAQEAVEVTRADDLLGDLLFFKKEVLKLLDDAKACGDIRSAIASIDQARKIVETLAEVRGEIDRNNTVNIVVMPEFIEFRETIIHALIPYPEAQNAVLKAVRAKF
jgi:hypothetical protein